MLTLRPALFARYLVPASLLFLGLPYAIFCIGWLAWYWALPGVGLFVAALIESTRIVFREEITTEEVPATSPQFGWRHALFLLLVLLVWLGFSGTGAFSFQRSDWLKHESILKDLIEYSWPVIYDLYAYPVPIVYYVAYYLPAAVVGKLGGWNAAQVTLFIWSYIGLILSVLWFSVLARKLSFWMVLLFILFSGLDVVGNTILHWQDGSILQWVRTVRFDFELEYSSNTHLLYYVPNQAFGGWIATGLTMYAILQMRQRSITWFPFGLSALWAPFVTVGLAPYLLVEFLTDETPFPARVKRYLSWPNLCGLLIFLLMAIFYLSKSYEISPYMHEEIPHQFYFSSPIAELPRKISVITVFWLAEVGIYILLLWRAMKSEQRKWRWLYATTILLLTVLPFYRMGIHNDFVMRVSIPALFCLLVLMGRTLHRDVVDRLTKIALIFALAIGSVTSLAGLSYSVAGTYKNIMGLPNDPTINTRGIVEVYLGLPDYFLQYVGSFESPFFQYFSKEKNWVSQADQDDFIAFADKTILFESYELEKEDGLLAGEQHPLISKLHVFFRKIDTNYNISLRLVSEAGIEIWKEQGWPENRPTSIWAPSTTWFDTRKLTIPEGTPPGIYRLDLSFVDPVARDLLPAFAMPSAKFLGQIVPIGFITVGEIEEPPKRLLAQPAQLDGKVALVGTTPLPEQPVSAGQSLQIELIWEAMAEMDLDYTGFVQLIAADGTLVAQNDHQPRYGFLPTTIWREGVTIADPYTLVIPPETSADSYSLIAGMYDLESGVRLPISMDGKAMGNSIEIGVIDVQ